MQLLLRLVNTLPVLAVHDEDETLCSGIVMPPERANLVLTSNIPYIEFNILVRDRFNVEANYEKWLRGLDEHESSDAYLLG